jgi:hypothetical protein
MVIDDTNILGVRKIQPAGFFFSLKIRKMKAGQYNKYDMYSKDLKSCAGLVVCTYHCRLPKTVQDFLIVVVGAFEHADPKVLSTSIQIG